MATISVNSGTASVQLVAVNSARSNLIIENTDANRLYVLLNSGTASATNYSFSLAQNDNALLPGFTGEVSGIWSADGAGVAQITHY